MRLNQIARARAPVFSFEFFPPKSDAGTQNLLRAAVELAELRPAFFSMTYGAGGTTRDKTVRLAHQIQQRTQIDTVCHLTCTNQSKAEVRGVLDEIAALGMSNIMALRGDPPRGETDWRPHPDGFQHAFELVLEIRRRNGFSVGVAGFPETHPDALSREADLQFMKEKVECGADVIVTQLFFDNAYYFRYVGELRALGVSVPVIPGLLPIRSVLQIRNFCALCKSAIPPALEARMTGLEQDDEAARELGVAYATEQLRELLDRGAPGVHLYCLNRSDSVRSILRNVKLI